MPPLQHAADLLGASGWRNTDRPVDLRHEMSGRVVLLLFFAPRCVHSRNALATMTFLDAAFAGRPLTVLGVASPREPNDTWLDEVLDETGVRFPVAIDDELRVFEAYGCGAWPTLVVIDGIGQVRYFGAGEPDGRALADAARTLLAEIEYGGYQGPPPPARVVPPLPAAVLLHPQGLALDPARGRLWVADTAHHRLLALDASTGEVLRVLGRGPGASDGGAEQARFCAPRGLWFDAVADRLLVADAGNHLLRAVDAGGNVVTLLGNGARGHDRYGGARGPGQSLGFPCAVVGDGVELVLALTGVHQLWSVSTDGVGVVRAGTGFAGLLDGVAAHARLAEPMGMAWRGNEVVFCDSGNHALRVWDRQQESVRTLVGGQQAGDADGDLTQARLCFPAAVAWHDDGTLLVADTGNGKIRRVDLAGGRVATLDLGVELRHPCALALAGDRLFVADSAFDRILVHEFGTAARVLEIGLAPADTVPGIVRLRSSADCVLKLGLDVPQGAAVHPDVGVRVQLRVLGGQPLVRSEQEYEATVEGTRAVVRGVTTGTQGGDVQALVLYHTTHGQGRVSHAQSAELRATFDLQADAPSMARWDG